MRRAMRTAAGLVYLAAAVTAACCNGPTPTGETHESEKEKVRPKPLGSTNRADGGKEGRDLPNTGGSEPPPQGSESERSLAVTAVDAAYPDKGVPHVSIKVMPRGSSLHCADGKTGPDGTCRFSGLPAARVTVECRRTSWLATDVNCDLTRKSQTTRALTVKLTQLQPDDVVKYCRSLVRVAVRPGGVTHAQVWHRLSKLPLRADMKVCVARELYGLAKGSQEAALDRITDFKAYRSLDSDRLKKLEKGPDAQKWLDKLRRQPGPGPAVPDGRHRVRPDTGGRVSRKVKVTPEETRRLRTALRSTRSRLSNSERAFIREVLGGKLPLRGSAEERRLHAILRKIGR